MRIDHVIYATQDLAAAAARLEADHGLRATGGGRHAGIGTENRIVPLGGGYLELIAVADRAEAERSALGAALAERDPRARRGPDGLGRSRVDDVLAEASRTGAELSTIERDGLRAQLAGVSTAMADPSLPFFIARDPGSPTRARAATRAGSPGSRSPATPSGCAPGSAAAASSPCASATARRRARRRHRRPRAALTAGYPLGTSASAQQHPPQRLCARSGTKARRLPSPKSRMKRAPATGLGIPKPVVLAGLAEHIEPLDELREVPSRLERARAPGCGSRPARWRWRVPAGTGHRLRRASAGTRRRPIDSRSSPSSTSWRSL